MKSQSNLILLEGSALKGTFYHFPKGIPGFEDITGYQLIEDKETPLAQLVAVDNEDIGFILIRPWVILSDYIVEADKEGEATLQISADTTVELQTDIWVILTINPQELNKSSVNLRAPIILNKIRKLGIQLILNDDKYGTKHPLPIDENANEQQKKGVEG